MRGIVVESTGCSDFGRESGTSTSRVYFDINDITVDGNSMTFRLRCLDLG